MELIAIGLCLVILLQHATYARERAQLLDRLMSRSWGEYVQGVRAPDQTPITQMTTDEIEAAWYAAHGRQTEAA